MFAGARGAVHLILCCTLATMTAHGQAGSATSASHGAQVDQLELYLKRRLDDVERARPGRWQRDFSSPDRYRASVSPQRRRLSEILGTVPQPSEPLAPRRTKLAETSRFTAEQVWLPVLPGIDTYGILLRPKNVAGRRAPALVCQHGMTSGPEQVCGLVEPMDYAKRFGARAAERGYVVFAPFMTIDVKTKSRLDRLAILAGTRLQALEQAKVLRAVDFLQSLPEVDPAAIGIYGISWGGRTAMYAAALDERIAAAVISGHFNHTVRMMVESSPHYTPYIATPEDYAFFSGLIVDFSDSDVVSLIAPRPVFVETGTRDNGVYYPMAQAEFTLVQKIYSRLGVGDRAAFGLFEGGHEIEGEMAFSFLDRFLRPNR